MIAEGIVWVLVIGAIVSVLAWWPKILVHMARLKRWGGGARGQAPMSTRDVTMNRAVADLRSVEPGVAEILDRKPALDPQRVPDEVDATTITRDATDRNLDRYDQHVTILLRALRDWIPRSPTYGDEMGFANSMRVHLRKSNIREHDYEMDPDLRWDLNTGAPKTLRPDFVFWKRLLVEVKGDMFRSSDSDRSLGQLFRYLLAWKSKGPAMLIVCGECDPLLRMLIRQYVAVWRDKPFELPVTVFFAKHETDSEVPRIAAS
jgi:hypothetical protein